MSLTVGTGPFGHRPAGTFNFELPRTKGLIYFEDSPRRIRARLGGETVVDSRHAKLLHEHASPADLLLPAGRGADGPARPRAEKQTHCPYKGEAPTGPCAPAGKVAEDAAWSYPEPIEDAPPLAGYVAFYWNAMDEWLEEDEPAIVHARDPYHRVDILDTSRHVRVSVNGETVAETTRARVLFETGLPPRWYFPREDVRLDLLAAERQPTGCAYKGFASYWSVGDEEDVVWSYPEPLREAERIRDYLAFFNERVDIEVDGEPQERPVTQWSRRT